MQVLWTKSSNTPTPWELIRLRMCREVYHCTPDKFDELSIETVLMDLELLAVEKKVSEFQGKT